MKHRIIIASAAGDTAVAEWEVGDAEAEKVACGVYDQATSEGWAAVTPTPTGAVAVDKFSPSLEEIMLLRPIAGG